MPAKKTAAKKATKAKPAAEKETPAKSKASNGKVAAFTLDDVQSLLKTKKKDDTATEKKVAKKAAKKKVVEEVEDEEAEITLEEALAIDPTAEMVLVRRVRIDPSGGAGTRQELLDRVNESDSGHWFAEADDWDVMIVVAESETQLWPWRTSPAPR